MENAEMCGTTAVCCLVKGQDLVLAHVGDSRAVLCREGKAVRWPSVRAPPWAKLRLTKDHKLGA